MRAKDNKNDDIDRVSNVAHAMLIGVHCAQRARWRVPRDPQPPTGEPRAMSKSDTEPPPTRREAVWAVCDQLSAQGLKPSLRSVKMHYPRGSDTDVQKDVNGWYEYVFMQHARRRVIPALPDAVVRAMESFWETASLEADSQFAKAREAHEAIQAELKAQLGAARAESAEAKTVASKAERDAVDLRLELAHRTTDLESAEQDVTGLRQELDALRRHAQMREQAQHDEINRTKETHARTLTAQREDFELQVKLVREAAAQQAEEQQRALARSDEHYRDLERRALVEVDSARTQLKTANESIERYRTLAHDRDLELVGLRTELRLMRDGHKTQIDALVQRNEKLTADVEGLRERLARGTARPAEEADSSP